VSKEKEKERASWRSCTDWPDLPIGVDHKKRRQGDLLLSRAALPLGGENKGKREEFALLHIKQALRQSGEERGKRRIFACP